MQKTGVINGIVKGQLQQVGEQPWVGLLTSLKGTRGRASQAWKVSGGKCCWWVCWGSHASYWSQKKGSTCWSWIFKVKNKGFGKLCWRSQKQKYCQPNGIEEK